MKRSKLFIYEHGVCGERIPDEIAIEGVAMFKSLLSFGKYFDLVSFVRDDFRSMFPFGRGSFKECLEICDKAIIVAPEDEFTLLNLTREVEKAGVENLGSSSEAIEITSDKWKTFKKIKNKVATPETSLKPLDCEYVVKPRVSCGGCGIRIGGDVPDGFLAQELIKGKPLSVSLYVGEDVRVLSVNEQILENFSYKGGIVPADHDRDVIEAAISSIESIKGLKGYVGVDIVLADQPFVIEINARLTTPVIVFEHVYGMSYADMLWSFVNGRDVEIKPKRRVMFYKGHGEGFVSYGGNSIILKEA